MKFAFVWAFLSSWILLMALRHQGIPLFSETWMIAPLFLGLWLLFSFVRLPKKVSQPKKAKPAQEPQASKVIHLHQYRKKTDSSPEGNEWVRILQTPDHTRLMLAQSILEAQGLRCQVQNQQLAGLFGNIEPFQRELKVQRQDQEQALALLSEENLLS